MPPRHRTSDFDYHLPKELIAQRPAPTRSESRLLILRRDSGTIEHRRFTDIVGELRPDDVLVVNDTKVIPARLIGKRHTGGKVEALLLETDDPDRRRWAALMKTRGRLQEGEEIDLSSRATLRTIERRSGMEWAVEIIGDESAETVLDEIGLPPLPPYIEQDPADAGRREEDLHRYQTVYAQEEGAIAAPTAGLHFTEDLLDRIRSMGTTIIPVTLHVGLGTFLPVKSDCLEDHPMHSERYRVSADAASAIRSALADGRRIVAVGTTSCRVLESVDWSQDGPISGSTDLFIYPPYEFRAVDALLTNFHLPKSTLLALVSALAGRDLILAAYQEAIDRQYRFYSYGDAMLIV